MKHLLKETHRRSIWQVLAVYVGVSWAVLQVVDVLTQNMGLPPWVFPFALVLLLIGLPVMLATAIIQGREGRVNQPVPARVSFHQSRRRPRRARNPMRASTPASCSRGRTRSSGARPPRRCS